MGWLDPYEAVPGSGNAYELTPSESPSDPLASARVSLTGQEFFLLEYRLQDPNGDRRFTFSDDLNTAHQVPFWKSALTASFAPSFFRTATDYA